MNRLLSLFLIFVATLSFSQQNEQYIEYHKNCRLAEQHFIEQDTIQCLNTYTKVFSDFELLFPRDCFMAAQIAHKMKHDSLAVQFICKGIPFGLSPEFFSNDSSKTIASNMYQLSKTKYWKKIELLQDSLTILYNKSINWNLKTEIMNMVKVDQDWRGKNNKWFNRNFRKGLEKKFQIVNNKHMTYLDSIFKTLGYPGSWLIGIGDSLLYDETTYAAFNNSNLNESTNIILFHNDSAYVKHGDFLLTEINKGHIHPRTYAMIRDFRDRHLVKKDKDEEMFFNIWWKRDNFTKEEFEIHCYEIGCPTKNHLRNLSNSLGKGYDIFWYPFR